ncbi:hypothetical protein KM043_004959 [Ampulex compressa]|nr:hypothetical protein KM043_004959 [Ampulex compressa]
MTIPGSLPVERCLGRGGARQGREDPPLPPRKLLPALSAPLPPRTSPAYPGPDAGGRVRVAAGGKGSLRIWSRSRRAGGLPRNALALLASARKGSSQLGPPVARCATRGPRECDRSLGMDPPSDRSRDLPVARPHLARTYTFLDENRLRVPPNLLDAIAFVPYRYDIGTMLARISALGEGCAAPFGASTGGTTFLLPSHYLPAIPPVLLPPAEPGRQGHGRNFSIETPRGLSAASWKFQESPGRVTAPRTRRYGYVDEARTGSVYTVRRKREATLSVFESVSPFTEVTPAWLPPGNIGATYGEGYRVRVPGESEPPSPIFVESLRGKGRVRDGGRNRGLWASPNRNIGKAGRDFDARNSRHARPIANEARPFHVVRRANRRVARARRPRLGSWHRVGPERGVTKRREEREAHSPEESLGRRLGKVRERRLRRRRAEGVEGYRGG